jgi:hypothetical protein
VLFIITLLTNKIQGIQLSLLVGLLLGNCLPLSLPRAFSDDDNNLGLKSGLTIKSKFKLFSGGILIYFMIHVLELISKNFIAV